VESGSTEVLFDSFSSIMQDSELEVKAGDECPPMTSAFVFGRLSEAQSEEVDQEMRTNVSRIFADHQSWTGGIVQLLNIQKVAADQDQPSNDSPSKDADQGGSSSGGGTDSEASALIGVAIAIPLAALACIGGIVFYFYRKKKHNDMMKLKTHSSASSLGLHSFDMWSSSNHHGHGKEEHKQSVGDTNAQVVGVGIVSKPSSQPSSLASIQPPVADAVAVKSSVGESKAAVSHVSSAAATSYATDKRATVDDIPLEALGELHDHSF